MELPPSSSSLGAPGCLVEGVGESSLNPCWTITFALGVVQRYHARCVPCWVLCAGCQVWVWPRKGASQSFAASYVAWEGGLAWEGGPGSRGV